MKNLRRAFAEAGATLKAFEKESETKGLLTTRWPVFADVATAVGSWERLAKRRAVEYLAVTAPEKFCAAVDATNCAVFGVGVPPCCRGQVAIAYKA